MAKKPTRKRIWVNKLDYDKIDKYAKKKGKVAGNRIVDNLMEKFIEEHNL